jgi:hypothetical protein
MRTWGIEVESKEEQLEETERERLERLEQSMLKGEPAERVIQ